MYSAICSTNLLIEKNISYTNLPETSSQAFFKKRFSQLRHGSDQLTKLIESVTSSLFPGKNSHELCDTQLFHLVSSWPLNRTLLKSMKRPPYSLLLALRNARRTGRMSERGNCFPFLRKVNGPLEIMLQFRRLMEAAMPGVAV